MYNNDEYATNNCCCCGAIIPVYETICHFCLMDKEKESAYEDYMEDVSRDW